MKQITIFMFSLLLMFVSSGCATVKGYTLEDKRQYILNMRERTLEELFRVKPIAKMQIENSAGYAVFSNINSHLLLVSMSNGYGVIMDNLSGGDTYLKMRGLGGGPGIGIKDFRAVIIFKKSEDIKRFMEKGWDFHGQFDAVAMSGEKGGSISGAQSLDLDIVTYQLTEAGIALQLTVQGTKFWNYDALNYSDTSTTY